MAVSGHNGNNESLISNSSMISLSFFDENANEIQFINSNHPVDIFIKRDRYLQDFDSTSQYVNATQINIDLENSIFLTNSFKIKSNNASVHIELKPFNLNTSYLMLLKFGNLPILNSTYSDLTSYRVFCPSKVIFKNIYIF